MEDVEEPSSDETLKDEQLGMLVRRFNKYMDEEIDSTRETLEN